jgi:predicted DNA repair protein MutK
VLDPVTHTIHALAEAAGAASGPLAVAVAWIVSALGAAVVGMMIGGVIVAVVRRFTTHPEQLIVD